MMISLARAGPTIRTKRVVVPTPSGTPRSTSGIQNWASAAAMRKSQARARPHPPPTACPFTAAMVACSRFSSVVLARSKSRRNWLLRERKSRRRSSGVAALAWAASAPAEKTGGAPVTITTRVEASSRSSANAAPSSVSMSSLSELRRSGRLRVTVAMGPSRVRRALVIGSSDHPSPCPLPRGERGGLLVGQEAKAAVADELDGAGKAPTRATVGLDGGAHRLVEEARDRAGEPPPHLAVALDHIAQLRHLAGQRLVEGSGREHRFLPAAHEGELSLPPQRRGPEPAQAGEEPDAEEAEHRGGPDVLADGGTTLRPAPLGPAGDRLAQDRGQDAVELVEVRLEVVGDDQDRAVRCRVLATDAVEAATPGLEVGH